jgi:hypothetical protein
VAPAPKPAGEPIQGRHAAPETPSQRSFGDPAATGQRPVAGTTLGDPTTEGLPLVGSLPLVGPLLDGAMGGGLPLVGSLPLVGPLLGGGNGGGLIDSLPVPLTIVQSLPIVGALVP